MSNIDFDPNIKGPQQHKWATYIPYRSTKPKFCTHRIASHAKSALRSGIGIIYCLEDGKWVEVFRRDETDKATGKLVCAGCGRAHKYATDPPAQENPYLHGRWRAGDDFVYEYWCGYKDTCMEASND